jgi:NAD(P)-dependent dehydrogenase (short-subunit alcohol dehydrogenase family)
MAVLFAREGSRVVLVDMYEERAKVTLGLIEGEGGEAVIVETDLAEPENCRRVVDETIARYGGVDILVNNAAIPLSKSLLDTTVEEYDRLMATNINAPFWLSKAAVPSMIERGGGSIINITSIAALRGHGGHGAAAYATAKSAMLGLTTDLADTFGKEGIRVNAIAPGIIATPQRDNAILQNGGDPSKLDLTVKTCLGIEGDAWDIARAALFLAGPDGRYITGVLLPVDGGTISRSH